MKITLDESWELCLKQWKWIAKQIVKMKRTGDLYSVKQLKREWCDKNNFKLPSRCSNCFFCLYSITHPTKSNPDKSIVCNCPAQKVDKHFDCQTWEYNYTQKPLKFYAKVRKLNNVRLKKKGAKNV